MKKSEVLSQREKKHSKTQQGFGKFNEQFYLFILLASQRFEVHSHEGNMSNMATDTDKQLNIQRQVDCSACVCVCCKVEVPLTYCDVYNVSSLEKLQIECVDVSLLYLLSQNDSYSYWMQKENFADLVYCSENMWEGGASLCLYFTNLAR